MICKYVCGTLGVDVKFIQILCGKPGRKRPVGRPRYRQEGAIIRNLKEMESEDLDWIQVT